MKIFNFLPKKIKNNSNDNLQEKAPNKVEKPTEYKPCKFPEIISEMELIKLRHELKSDTFVKTEDVQVV